MACFLGAKHPILKLQKNHSLRHQPTYKCDLRAKFEVFTLNGLAQSMRTNMKKRILTCFFAREAPNFFNYVKITLYGINPHTNVTYMQNLKVSTLNGLAYSVRTNMKKWILACFLRVKRPIFKLRKKSVFTASTHIQM